MEKICFNDLYNLLYKGNYGACLPSSWYLSDFPIKNSNLSVFKTLVSADAKADTSFCRCERDKRPMKNWKMGRREKDDMIKLLSHHFYFISLLIFQL